jgi:hypothetical protein
MMTLDLKRAYCGYNKAWSKAIKRAESELMTLDQN